MMIRKPHALLLALALIGWGRRTPLKMRLREVSPDLATLIIGVAVLLVWAGLVEAFLSQHLGGRYEPIGNDFKGSSVTVPEGADQVPGLASSIAKTESATN